MSDLPTQQQVAEAARTILRCNGHDLTQWGGDNLHDDSAREALKALAAQTARQCTNYPSHKCQCTPDKPLCLRPADAAIYHGDIDGDAE